MEPNELYVKARRNLVLFVGLFALSVWVGIHQKEQATSFLSFELEQPNFLWWVLGVAVVDAHNFAIWLLVDGVHARFGGDGWISASWGSGHLQS